MHGIQPVPLFFSQDPLIIPISEPVTLTYSSILAVSGDDSASVVFSAANINAGDLIFICADMGQSDHSDDGGAGWSRVTELVTYPDALVYRVRLYYRIASAGDASSGVSISITNNESETRPVWAGVARKAVDVFSEVVADASSQSTLIAPTTGNVFTENGIALFVWASKISLGVQYEGEANNGAIVVGKYNDGVGDMTAFAYKAVIGGTSDAVAIAGDLAGQENIAATFGLQ